MANYQAQDQSECSIKIFLQNNYQSIMGSDDRGVAPVLIKQMNIDWDLFV